jgi:ATP-dependent DNA helicase DinG
VPSLDDLLHAAVSGVGGAERPGQVAMAKAVAEALDQGSHLLVQAGTGTGKSLAYLVPAVQHAMESGTPAVVATATLALQAQIVDRDLPRLADAVTPLLGRRPTFAIVKGRRNYLCAHKLEGGFPDDDADSLLSVGAVDQQASRLGKEILRLRDWADETESGDRDELVPGVSERAWRQMSVSAHECLGSRCPVVADCFVEKSREAAKTVDVIVTNHSFMAIDAFEGRAMLPEHDLLVIDEGHELVDRVTATISDELSPSMVQSAAKKAGRQADASDTLDDAGVFLESVLGEWAEGRLMAVPETLALALARVRDTSRSVLSELKPDKGATVDGARQVALAAVEEVFDNSARILEERELDVVWVSKDPRRGSILRVAPMSVAMLVRDKVFTDRTVVLTSATLELGGTFDAVAGTIGLRGEGAPTYTGLDVGSPFNYPEQAIAYVAKDLPAPGRDGTSTKVFDELEALIRAAGGRTLGLFSSMRAAQAATEEMRERFERKPLSDNGAGPIMFLCQGEDQIGTLVRDFARDERTCLFGTLLVPARRHRPHPVPATRRPARLGPVGGDPADGRQRLHGGQRHSRSVAARTGRRPSRAPRGRSRRRGLPRLPDDDGAVCRVPPTLPAPLLAHDRPQPRARGAASPRPDGAAGTAGRRAGGAHADRRAGDAGRHPHVGARGRRGSGRRCRADRHPPGRHRSTARAGGPDGRHAGGGLGRAVRRRAA